MGNVYVHEKWRTVRRDDSSCNEIYQVPYLAIVVNIWPGQNKIESFNVRSDKIGCRYVEVWPEGLSILCISAINAHCRGGPTKAFKWRFYKVGIVLVEKPDIDNSSWRKKKKLVNYSLLPSLPKSHWKAGADPRGAITAPLGLKKRRGRRKKKRRKKRKEKRKN